MSGGNGRFDSCPVCGKQFRIDELNTHANTHFASATPSPAQEPQDSTVLRDLVIDYLPGTSADKAKTPAAVEGQDQQVPLGHLPTQTGHLMEVQTVEPQFRPGISSLSPMESVYISSRSLNNSTSILCVAGPLQHFCASPADKGWGCGYRNCQMLLSHLLLRGPQFQRALFGGVGYVPDIVSLQAWLECAWKQGYDPEGKHSLEGSVQGTTKWIGAIDIAALLRQFGIRAQFVDFLGRQSPHHPNFEGGTVHHGITCDFCSAQPIVGRRYTSRNIESFDLCEHCVHTCNAETFAPFEICGNQEIHKQTTCQGCRTSPIIGVRYQRRKNWRDTLCLSCYLNQTPLQQSPYVHRLISRAKNSNDQNHMKLMVWVWNYFTENGRFAEDTAEATGQRFIATGKAPLFIQHSGHSRTIVGIEQVTPVRSQAVATYSLIIFDPSTRSGVLDNSFERGTWPHVMKRGLHTLHQPEFQILHIEEGIASERETDSLKKIAPQAPILA